MLKIRFNTGFFFIHNYMEDIQKLYDNINILQVQIKDNYKQIMFIKLRDICIEFNVNDIYVFLDCDDNEIDYPDICVSIFKNEFEENNAKPNDMLIWEQIQSNIELDDINLLECFTDDVYEFYNKQLHYNVSMKNYNEIDIQDIL